VRIFRVIPVARWEPCWPVIGAHCARRVQLLHGADCARGRSVRPGTAVSRSLGDPSQDRRSNVARSIVRYLRQKLEEGGERRLIHTLRGRGLFALVSASSSGA